MNPFFRPTQTATFKVNACAFAFSWIRQEYSKFRKKKDVKVRVKVTWIKVTLCKGPQLFVFLILCKIRLHHNYMYSYKFLIFFKYYNKFKLQITTIPIQLYTCAKNQYTSTVHLLRIEPVNEHTNAFRIRSCSSSSFAYYTYWHE